MKKTAIFIISAVLCISLTGLFVFAEVPDGFEFDIGAIDTKVISEGGIILTSESALADSSTGWCILIQCEKVEDNLYKAKSDAITDVDGNVKTLAFDEDDIVIAIHSSSSVEELIDEHPNVVQKVTAKEVKAGMYIELSGIDLENNTVTDGKAICSVNKPDSEDKSSDLESKDETSSVSEEPDDESDEISADKSEDDEAEQDSTDDENISDAEDSKEEEKTESEIEIDDDKPDVLTIVLIAAAALAVIIVIIVIATRKKK